MMRLDDARIRAAEAIFRAALELPAEGQSAFVHERSGSDQELRALVERLLACDARSGALLGNTLRLRPGELTPDAQIPRRIGPFDIVREIGRGGMGVVFEAHQAHPNRRVALKLLRFVSPSPHLLRRFDLEAEALGQLNHPGIAHIYQAGFEELLSPAGQRVRVPYVAMELVHGKPLCEFADERGLDVRARVELLARICDAAQHAHQKGVIHRDLKPANILVAAPRNACESPAAKDNAHGWPKIVDFGVARVSDLPQGQTATATQTGALLGTVAYMSPEQLVSNSAAIDTRTDVYSLGVVAFELLTGRPPFDVSQLPLGQAIERVLHSEPPRASALRPELRGDLEVIVAKAMARAPQERYASAAELSADLRRWLSGEAVLARPASTWYLLRKTVARRPLESGLLATILMLLCGSAAALALLNWRVVHHWREAEAQGIAARAAQIAEAQARTTTEAVSGFLHEMLAAASPAERGQDASLLSVMRAAMQRLDAGALRDQPAAEAAVMTTLGSTWQALGQLEQAEALFAQALEIRRRLHGPVHAEVATALNHLGEARFLRGDLDGAEQCFNQALTRRLELFGEMHAGVAECHNNLALVDQERDRLDSAEQRLQEALRIWRGTLGPEHELLELCLHNLGSLMTDRGRFDPAVPLLREVYRLRSNRHGREDHPAVVHTRNSLAIALQGAGYPAESVQLHRLNLEIKRRTLPKGHRQTRSSTVNLGVVLRDICEYEEAARLLRAELGAARLDDVAVDPSLAELFGGLGVLLTDLEQPGEAFQVLQRVVEANATHFGEFHQRVANTLNNLAEAAAQLGDLDMAMAMMERVLAIDAHLNEARPTVSRALHKHHYATILLRRNDRAQAAGLFQDALEMRRGLLGEAHPLTRSSAAALAQVQTLQTLERGTSKERARAD